MNVGAGVTCQKDGRPLEVAETNVESMSDSYWQNCGGLEFPSDKEWAWTTDGALVRKGRRNSDVTDPVTKAAVWTDEHGLPLTVTHWADLECSPNEPPPPPQTPAEE